MGIEISPHGLHDLRKIKLIAAAIVAGSLLLMATYVATAHAQSQDSETQIAKARVVTIRLAPDQIGVVKTGEKLSTRLSFREPIKEVICGDLYDPSSGTGSFVIQRIDNDVFIKPVAPKGSSNMFVKTGERGDQIYNFSLLIVPPEQAYLIVKVLSTVENSTGAKSAKTRMTSIVPPVTTKVAMLDAMMSNTRGNAADGLFIKIRNYGEFRDLPPPPPPSPAPTAVAARQREPVRRVAPEYPESARMTGVSGEVIVEVTITRKGKIKTARAISGPLLLRNAAITAARLWRFKHIEDEDVGETLSTYRIKFNFTRPDNTESPALQFGAGGNRRRN